MHVKLIFDVWEVIGNSETMFNRPVYLLHEKTWKSLKKMESDQGVEQADDAKSFNDSLTLRWNGFH